jgi:hypothetical protein
VELTLTGLSVRLGSVPVGSAYVLIIHKKSNGRSCCKNNEGYRLNSTTFDFFFDKSEFISKNANLKGAPPNYTKSITKSA